MNPIKILCLFLGFLFFGLAALGVILPVLPTTPFLLLASYFFAKGSTRFNTWFTSTKLYKDHVDSFMKHRSLTRRRKIYICALASTMMLISFIVVDVLAARIGIACALAFMYYYFTFRIKTVSPEEDAALKAADKAEREASASAPIALKDTLGEVRTLHEDMFEESKKASTPSKNETS